VVRPQTARAGFCFQWRLLQPLRHDGLGARSGSPPWQAIANGLAAVDIALGAFEWGWGQ